MEELMRYDHVDISYNGVQAVTDVSFTLREGEILGIVGESGSGKSTLIKAAMGLLGNAGMVTRGDIWYRGKNISDLNEQERRRLNGPELGMIFQSVGSSFCPIRTVGAQLYESVTEHEAMSREHFQTRAVDLLQKIGFENARRILDSYPFELSGGMQQRVAIARALAMDTDILLMDEPFGAIDAKNRTILQELLLQLWEGDGTQEKKTVIFVTHDIDEAILLSDRIIMMSSHPGRVNQQISVPFERPRNRAELVQTREYSEFRNLLLSLFYSDIASKIGGDEVVL